MIRRYLTGYRIGPFEALNSGESTFEMTIRIVYLFGIFKRTRIISYSIPWHKSVKFYTDHWDEMIKNQTPIKLK